MLLQCNKIEDITMFSEIPQNLIIHFRLSSVNYAYCFLDEFHGFLNKRQMIEKGFAR